MAGYAMPFDHFSSELICDCFPADRVMMGVLVCKRFGDFLRAGANDVIFTVSNQPGDWHFDEEFICRALLAFVAGSGKSAAIIQPDAERSMKNEVVRRGSTVAKGLVLALEKGWSRLHKLELSFADVSSCKRLFAMFWKPHLRLKILRIKHLPNPQSEEELQYYIDALCQLTNSVELLAIQDHSVSSLSFQRLLSSIRSVERDSSIKSLDISGNLGCDHFARLPPNAPILSSLTSLNLSNNRLAHDYEFFVSLGRSLPTQQVLEVLNMSNIGQPFTMSATLAMTGLLKACRYSLKELDLSYNHTIETFDILAVAITRLSLETLNLKNTSWVLSGADWQDFAFPTRLKKLDISHDNPASGAAFDWVAEKLDGCSLLTELRASSPRRSSHGLDSGRYLSQAVRGCRRLKCLTYASGHLGDEGLQTAFEILAMCHYMRELDLSDNQLRSDGAQTLGRLLSGWKEISILRLDKNGFCDESMTHLAQGLLQCTKVRLLSLNGNDIGNSGIKTICAGIKPFRLVLQELYLKDNLFDEEGATHLCQNMKTPCIHKLEFRGQWVEPTTAFSLKSTYFPLMQSARPSAAKALVLERSIIKDCHLSHSGFS